MGLDRGCPALGEAKVKKRDKAAALAASTFGHQLSAAPVTERSDGIGAAAGGQKEPSAKQNKAEQKKLQGL